MNCTSELWVCVRFVTDCLIWVFLVGLMMGLALHGRNWNELRRRRRERSKGVGLGMVGGENEKDINLRRDFE